MLIWPKLVFPFFSLPSMFHVTLQHQFCDPCGCQSTCQCSNLYPPHLSISVHVPAKTELHHVLFNHLSLILLWSTSTSLGTIHCQLLTALHWGICTSPFHMSEPCQSCFPHLVLHRSYSHLVPDIFISNP